MSSDRRELISHHTFLLPFKWAPRDRDGFISAEEFEAVVRKYLATDNWTAETFSLDRVVDYNEFHYFYDYVREALYDYEPAKDEAKDEKKFIRHLSYKNADGGKYYIETPIPASARDPKHKYDDGTDDAGLRKTYELEIDSVLLHLYYTGVGVLSFHLHNRRSDQASPEDILYINQYGRRVFPPFYRIPHWKAGHQVGFDADDFTMLGRPHGGEIAYSIGLELPNHKRVTERWQDTPAKMLRDAESFTFRLAAFIEPFLGTLFTYQSKTDNPAIEKGVEEQSPGDFKIQAVLDDRMFTICWYGNGELVKALKPDTVVRHRLRNGRHRRQVEAADEHAIDKSRNEADWLYKYIFVDAGMVTVQHPAMRRKLLAEATYYRWADYGTYYGITDYSFVLLTDDLPALRQPLNNASYLVTHLQTIYFRLSELVLVQRACVQRFSDEVTHVSRLEVPHPDQPGFDELVTRLSDDANELYKRYIRFVNRVYFREVTAQTQGIELYEKLQQQARLPAMVDGLKEEVHDLHNYVRQETDRQLLKAEQRRSDDQRAHAKRLEDAEKKRNDTLSLLGALFIAPSLLVAVYDLGFIGDCLKEVYGWFYPGTVIAAIVAAGLSYTAFQTENKRARWGYGLLYLFLLAVPVLYCQWTHVPASASSASLAAPVMIIEDSLENATPPVSAADTLSPFSPPTETDTSRLH